jgi:hypothetical protein
MASYAIEKIVALKGTGFSPYISAIDIEGL